MSTTLDFQGQTIIVTGGTRGIGRRIAERYLDAGANVFVCGRRSPETLPSDGKREAVFVEADVRDVEAVQKVVGVASGATGRLDVLVNNAGGSPYAEAASASPRFHEKIITLNLTAPLHFAQAANAAMQEQDGGGVIINIASVSGTRASPGTAAYGAAKAGLLNLTKSLAVEWAPKVRVVAVTAGLVATEAADEHYGGEEGIRKVAATVPAKRFGTPDDIADACLFLASPLASYATGTSIVLDGGGEWPSFLLAAQGKLEM